MGRLEVIALETFGRSETFAAFCERLGLVVIVAERSKRSDLPRYCARIPNVEIGGDGLLRGVHGDGNTPEQAVNVLAQSLTGHHLVIDAYRDSRHTADAPNEWAK